MTRGQLIEGILESFSGEKVQIIINPQTFSDGELAITISEIPKASDDHVSMTKYWSKLELDKRLSFCAEVEDIKKSWDSRLDHV